MRETMKTLTHILLAAAAVLPSATLLANEPLPPAELDRLLTDEMLAFMGLSNSLSNSADILGLFVANFVSFLTAIVEPSFAHASKPYMH